KCLSSDLEWSVLKGTGTVVTFTETHVAGFSAFQDQVPYIVGVIKLEEGPQITGVIKFDKPASELRIGTEVAVDFDTEPSEYWPYWPHYFFTVTETTSLDI
ncbi:Zn-ribbon domain-containing OB-fold protein, partial [Chloroflexota bacterium]